MTVLFDVESRSRADLDTVGGRLYWQHPSSEILCLVYHDTTTKQGGTWRPGCPTPWARGATLAAHNAMGFDRFACERYGLADASTVWVDTSELARTAGLPGKLDALGTRWLGLPKDKEASKFTKGLSSVRRPSKGDGAISAADWRLLDPQEKRELGVHPEITEDVLRRVIDYCRSDVDIMVAGWPLLESWVNLEPEISRVDRAINDRGVYFDAELAEALLIADEIHGDTVVSEVAREIGWKPEQVRAAARSPQQFTEATGAIDATKDTVTDLVENKRGPMWRLGLARQALASIVRGKLEAGLTLRGADDRIRDSHRYYGGHTGRWSGRGMQLQNLTRPAGRFEKWSSGMIDSLADRVKAGRVTPTPDLVDMLLRATICAAPGKTFAVCDFSGVEARALAWAAGDEGALAIYREGKTDAYKVMAATIFGVPYSAVTKEQRGIGKIAELACGYGMGWRKFYGNNPDKLDRVAASLGKSGETFAEDVVAAWRKQHAASRNLWYDLERAFKRAANGQYAECSCFSLRPSDDGRDVALFLPSGRPIVYTDVEIHDSGLTYISPTKNIREHLYGGLLVENAIQSLCRDLLALALVVADEVGLNPVMHVHDEIVCEVDESQGAEAYETLHETMTTLPGWADGFPIGAAGFHGRRYRK